MQTALGALWLVLPTPHSRESHREVMFEGGEQGPGPTDLQIQAAAVTGRPN